MWKGNDLLWTVFDNIFQFGFIPATFGESFLTAVSKITTPTSIKRRRFIIFFVMLLESMSNLIATQSGIPKDHISSSFFLILRYLNCTILEYQMPLPIFLQMICFVLIKKILLKKIGLSLNLDKSFITTLVQGVLTIPVAMKKKRKNKSSLTQNQ